MRFKPQQIILKLVLNFIWSCSLFFWLRLFSLLCIIMMKIHWELSREWKMYWKKFSFLFHFKERHYCLLFGINWNIWSPSLSMKWSIYVCGIAWYIVVWGWAWMACSRFQSLFSTSLNDQMELYRATSIFLQYSWNGRELFVVFLVLMVLLFVGWNVRCLGAMFGRMSG